MFGGTCMGCARVSSKRGEVVLNGTESSGAEWRRNSDDLFGVSLPEATRETESRFVAQALAANRDSIRQGFYFAWDPLAAVALVNPAVATFRPLAIEISQKPKELGRTIETKGRRADAQVAIDADVLRFRDIFMTALGVR